MVKLGGAGLCRYGFQFALAYLVLLVLGAFLLGGGIVLTRILLGDGIFQLSLIASMMVLEKGILLVCPVLWVSKNFIQDNGRAPSKKEIWHLTIVSLLISGIIKRFYFAIITEWKMQSVTSGVRGLFEAILLKKRHDHFWALISLDIFISATSIVIIYLLYRIISGRMSKT